MPIILFVTLFCLVLVSFLANPAPSSIESSDLILIGLPCLIGILSIATTNVYKIYRTEFDLLVAVIVYLSYLLLSALMGVLHGVPILNVLRSIGPYINFFPLLLIGFLPTQIMRPMIIASILIMIGLLQIGYLLYLYFIHSIHVNTIVGVLVDRITLLDQRTTLPLLLAVTTLPIIISLNKQMSGKKKFLLNIISIALILLGLFAGIITLTRAIVLSIIFGWIVFIIVYLYHQSRINIFLLLPSAGKLCMYVFCFIAVLLMLSYFPKIHMLESGLLARFYNAGIAGSDYSNGRLYDEWLPALMTWSNSDLLSLFFGMGAGTTFTVLNGEERTYIHNLCIYSLVYGGFYGFFACIWLYFTLFKTLIIRAQQTHNILYIAFSALISSMFFYGQLFAVHKGLAFNVMLFLIIAIALSQPIHEVKLRWRTPGNVWN